MPVPRDVFAGSPLVDAHVHIHRCFDLAAFFAGAAENFARAARSLGLEARSFGTLLLTERAGADGFERLLALRGELDGWRVEPTPEPISVLVTHESGAALLVVAGRQVETAERIEVLGLGCRAMLDDGRELKSTLAAVRTAGALPGLAWGFGKWWFGRGRLVDRALAAENPRDFFLGDQAGRLQLARPPRQFALAAERGIRVLAGTDPAPSPAQVSLAGSYGFLVNGTLDAERPAASLLRLLRDGGSELQPYGAATRLLPFLRKQVAAQWRRLSRAA